MGYLLSWNTIMFLFIFDLHCCDDESQVDLDRRSMLSWLGAPLGLRPAPGLCYT